MRPVWPARVTNGFAAPGSYASRTDKHGPAGHHTGVDFGSAWPLPIFRKVVRAGLPGEVVISGFNSTMGNWVGVYNVDHDVTITYWHMDSRFVNVGDWVQVYQKLGKVGTTGNSTAPHSHVQANRGRGFNYAGHINPWPFLNSITRKDARRIFRRAPKHPMQP